MKIILYHEKHFEAWDYRNIDVGIGGSETHQVEMSWRLAERGHEVISYAPIPDDCQRYNLCVEWRHIKDVNWSEDGLWVIYRSPECVDNLQNQTAWLLMQDVDYPELTKERASKFDKLIPLCNEHAKLLGYMKPFTNGNLWVSSNGIRSDIINKMRIEERNPLRVMYASSPDRGLVDCLETFQKARRYIPELEFHLFYGFDNIDKIIAKGYKPSQELKDHIMNETKKPGIFWHGRISQKELYKEWLKSGIWLYQTNFFETSCITCMEAQALGAIPITRPNGALADNVKHGVFIQGDCANSQNKARYMAELINLAGHSNIQELFRVDMMVDARMRFDWDRVVDQWDSWLNGWDYVPLVQYNFQYKYAKGKILNIGCHTDSGRLKEKKGAINLDRWSICPHTQLEINADIIADAREALPFSKEFDTIVIGDLLEHLSQDDAIKVLDNAKNVLNNDGQIVITCPDDQRITEPSNTEGFEYHHPMSKETVEHIIKQLKLRVLKYQPLRYPFTDRGHGFLVGV